MIFTDFTKYLFLTFILVLCSSCSKTGKYDTFIQPDSPEKSAKLIKMLDDSGIEYELKDNGRIFFSSKNKDVVLNLVFHSDKPSYKSQIPDYTKSWKITIDDARNTVLKKYPDIFQNARISSSVTATLESGLDGFAKKNEKVWHIRVICNKGGIHALFFIHPVSGDLYTIQSPDEKESHKCT